MRHSAFGLVGDCQCLNNSGNFKKFAYKSRRLLVRLVCQEIRKSDKLNEHYAQVDLEGFLFIKFIHGVGRYARLEALLNGGKGCLACVKRPFAF